MRQSEWQAGTLRPRYEKTSCGFVGIYRPGQNARTGAISGCFWPKADMSRPIYTGNPDIDRILNDKLRRTKDAGARLELDIKPPESFPADAFDLNVSLGNLLNNAVETHGRLLAA